MTVRYINNIKKNCIVGWQYNYIHYDDYCVFYNDWLVDKDDGEIMGHIVDKLGPNDIHVATLYKACPNGPVEIAQVKHAFGEFTNIQAIYDMIIP
jgi:hypothetical protein